MSDTVAKTLKYLPRILSVLTVGFVLHGNYCLIAMIVWLRATHLNAAHRFTKCSK